MESEMSNCLLIWLIDRVTVQSDCLFESKSNNLLDWVTVCLTAWLCEEWMAVCLTNFWLTEWLCFRLSACIYIYRRHFRQSVVKMPLHPFYLHLILYNLYIRLFYTHRLHTLLTLCFIHYYYFVCILRLHPCAKRLCSFQSHIYCIL